MSFKSTSGLTRCGLVRAASTPSPIVVPYQTVTGLTPDGIKRIAQAETRAATLSTKQVNAEVLTTQQRKGLKKSDFAIPSKAPGPGSYPLNDRAHAANALARSKGKPEEATVRRAVCSRYPDLPACKE
jgi:hypothetical protein